MATPPPSPHDAIALRGVHVDFKGLPPTPQRLERLLRLAAAAGYNAALLEWEDAFPWTVDERFRSETAYTPDQVRHVAAVADELGVELIPLVQCLGHMETFLRPDDYRALRELPDRPDGLNPLAPGAGELVARLVDDVLALTPGIRRFHLGGDEAWTFGSHPDTAAFIARHGKAELYLRHVEPLFDRLDDRGVRPLLWHDMMIGWDDAALRRLAPRADLVVWGYRGHPDHTDGHHAARHIRRFADAGLTLWGATAYKGADAMDGDLPDLAERHANAAAWAEVARRHRFQGVIATGWSRYATHCVQCEPVDACLDALVSVAGILQGHDPATATRHAQALLEELGEAERADACRAAVAALRDARLAGWTMVRRLRQQLTLAHLESPRRSPPHEADMFRRIRAALADIDAAGERILQTFAGLVPDRWLRLFVAERRLALQHELDLLEREAQA